MRAAVAAGHPATVDAGAEILEAGGTAADAAVAACLASCVAETVMTGFLGGGHALYWQAGTGAEQARALDCFVAVPGLGKPAGGAKLVRLEVPFGHELVHYAVGIASCGVPGVPAGLDALWRAYGRLPWERLVEPALALARGGVEMPPAHVSCLAMLAPVMTMREGARIYSPGGRLLETGDRLEQRDLVRALEVVAGEGALTVYRGALASALLALSEERGGLITAADLEAYGARWRPTETTDYLGRRLATRQNVLLPPHETLARLPPVRTLAPGDRAVALVRTLLGAPNGAGHTTNITVVDQDGSACVLSTSLGLGSGDWLPGYDLHLNSMLGEVDLVLGELAPGERMASMMSPTLVFDRDGIELAAGAAGGTRLRSALVQVVAGMLDEGLSAVEAVERPRLHPAGELVHLEPGLDGEVGGSLEAEGFVVREWESQHHFFGGVSVVGRTGAAGDPRRSGGARVVAG